MNAYQIPTKDAPQGVPIPVLIWGSVTLILQLIAFRAVESEMGQALLHGSKGRRFWLVGRPKLDDWGSRPAAELHLEDAAWAD